MKRDSFYAAERFIKTLEKVGAEDLFDRTDEGNLTTLVHTGRIVDSFRIDVEFSGNSIVATTHSCLGVADKNAERVKNLLDSLNRMNSIGEFFIGGDCTHVVSFRIYSDFGRLEAMDNPFDLVFKGASLIVDYAESIIRTLLGAQIVYAKL